MEPNPLLNWLTLRILIFFAGIIAFLLTERHFAFDWKQKLKMFIGFFVAAYLGLVIFIVLLGMVSDYIRNAR